MKTIKIKLSTAGNAIKKKIRYQRNIGPREAFLDVDLYTKNIFLKDGRHKWKPFDTTISRKTDLPYIQSKKDMYSGLCFRTQKDAKEFMKNHEEDLKRLSSKYPNLNHWSLVNVSEKFAPTNAIMYGKDYVD